MAAKKEEGRISPPAIGGASLLVVFAVLCLTVFALLSLSTVRADGRLSEVSAQSVEEFYRADCRAQEVLAQLRGGETVSKDIKVTSKNISDDGVRYSYDCPISDTQTLEVTVEFRDGEYTVRRWQAVPTGEWTVDDSLTVWDGE